MKDLINVVWEWALSRNLERLSSPYRSYGDIEMFTSFEILLFVVTSFFAVVMVCFWIKDWRVGAKAKLERQRELAMKRAEDELAAAQRRLLCELEFTFAPCSEEADVADGSEDFFEVFYRVCPEFAPTTVSQN